MPINKPEVTVVEGELTPGQTVVLRVQQQNTGEANDNTWHAIAGDVDGGVPFGYVGEGFGTDEVVAPITIPEGYTGTLGVETTHVSSQQEALQGFTDQTPPQDKFRASAGQVSGGKERVPGVSNDMAVGAAGGFATGIIATLAGQALVGRTSKKGRVTGRQGFMRNR